MIHTKTTIGPEDHGRRMSLKEFEPIRVREGYLYELGRGTIVVSDVPGFSHLRIVSAVRKQFSRYQDQYPEEIYEILGTMECKLLVGEFESERHPDLAIYKRKPPRKASMWFHWLPDIVVEVVSLGSKLRDYTEKREEYLALGIKEYWIVDAKEQKVLILRRSRGKWIESTLRPGDLYQTKLLPGFEFDCAKVFAAAE